MTSLTFLSEADGLCGFDFSGHAMSAGHGHDIVCAAVSSAAYLTANTITDVIGRDADILVEDGHFRLVLAGADDVSRVCLRGLLLHMEGLTEQYPDNLRIKYRKVK